ncbi:MAG: SLC13 family permease [Vicinamibacterales bacterium]|nr:SLC13 family permease [Vicinamibacterales bacterium]
MTPATASLLALLIAIALSCTSRVNVGLLAIALAWLVSLYAGRVELVTAGFPAQLFLTLAGVTLLFALAEVNGTLGRVAFAALRLVRGRAALVPWVFFLIACGISSVGPGSIASVALVVPMAMAVGARTGMPPFLTALMVANGANAGNLSPFSAVGVIANTNMAAIGLGGTEVKVWAANFLAHVVVGGAAYVMLGGPRLRGEAGLELTAEGHAMTASHWTTVTVVAAWIAGVIGLGLPLGPSAFAAAVILVVARMADESAAIKRMPWNAVLMVTGMSVLVSVLEATGGMALFTTLLATLATPGSLHGVMAFVTGLISTYSSTSGVVLPTFLPTVPGLVAQVGGGDPLTVALSINVGASIVDVSPLSTLGALCVAAVVDPRQTQPLFRSLMIWGLSMTVVGGVLCQLLMGAFARL